ncbi:MAG: hypothetical protein JSW52_10855 [Candidatus Coatesbacteria bacterium]|nr:MAG: hypothetical protein JSW52_10855 [Candidatus Coatesbacteria bacterium]
MTALTENYDAERKDGILITYPVSAGETVYKGALVCLDADGYVVPGDDASGYAFVGVSYEKADNTDGADGDATARVWKVGTYVFAADFTAGQEDVGSEVYVVDDNTVSTSTTYAVACGTVVEVISSASVRVRIDNSVK